ncbi:hypothetical protein RJ640_029109 [Escallonia rubra]|uniref:Rab-GAP TBC domain-containing protein n=1 Tax=Escallonia rubra TaxID=112253 RepID=A0AA88R8N5_9ASTE|nr:hypothetical protein RJ640_029109 [Escallonia rubra]
MSSTSWVRGVAGSLINNYGTEEVEAYFPIRPECRADVPKTRFKPRVRANILFLELCWSFIAFVGKTLSARRWNAAFSRDGRLDIAGVLRRIQRGFLLLEYPGVNTSYEPQKLTRKLFNWELCIEGIHPSIKGVVWEFLLGCFDSNSTFDERNELRQQRREQYAAWKGECQKMVPVIGSGKLILSPIVTDDGQPIRESSINSDSQLCEGTTSKNDVVVDKKVIQWKLVLHQIGLDVVRTDRALIFYENEANQAKLWDVLAIYAWVDNEIGYVQGMSDICSPMVNLLENEADAFWCFEHAMRRVRENFRCSTSSIGVQSQLSTLAQIINVVDPKLHHHLEELDGGEYLFAFRMLMVLFRREFSYVDALYLWEVMWAMEYNPNIFALYEESSGLGAAATHKDGATKVNDKLLKQYGKFERHYVKTGHMDQKSALAVFLVASVLETKNKQLLKEAKGLDDVVKILGDMTGNLDAKKALNEALKIHKKYINKASFICLLLVHSYCMPLWHQHWSRNYSRFLEAQAPSFTEAVTCLCVVLLEGEPGCTIADHGSNVRKA